MRGRVTVPSPIVPVGKSIPDCLCGLESAMVSLGGLGGDFWALIHVEDAEIVAPYHWTVVQRSQRFYTMRWWRDQEGQHLQRMHMLLTGFPLTDHKDGNGLNNRRCNLREATNAENSRNCRQKRSEFCIQGRSPATVWQVVLADQPRWEGACLSRPF